MTRAAPEGGIAVTPYRKPWGPCPKVSREDAPETPDRATGIGASEIAMALGLHPSRTPVMLWLLKTGRADYAGKPVPAPIEGAEVVDTDDDGTPEMMWGRTLEPAILDWYARASGLAMYEASYDGRAAARDPEFPNVWASPDRVAVDENDARRCVEAKAVGWQMAHKWGEPGTDKVPVEYWLQVQIQTRCTRAALDPHVVAAIAGRPPQVWEVPYDAALARQLAERAQEWFDYYVTGDREPPAVKPEDSAKLVRALFPRSVERTIEVTPRLREAVEAVRSARAVRDEAVALVEFHEAAVKRIVGDAERVKDPEFSITWRNNKAGARPFRLTFKGEREE